MRKLAFLLLALIHALALPVAAQAAATASHAVAIERWVEEWDEASRRWVRVSDPEIVPIAQASHAERLAPARPQPIEISRSTAQAQRYGPFLVLDRQRAALVGTTDSFSPDQFRQMLATHPDIAVLELIEAPGTRDDIANLRLGRMIRAAGISTHVPRDGSVRSGAVELFLAGATRAIEDGAQFAVHAWIDIHGREPADFAADAPENRLYLDYYRDMGMAEAQARAFYAMTNSAPHESALWLGADEMRGWIVPGAGEDSGPAQLAAASRCPAGDEGGLVNLRLALLDLGAAIP